MLFDRIGVSKETVATDLAEELAFITVVLVKVDHGSAASGTADVFRNVTVFTAPDGLKLFTILPAIVFEKIYPVPALRGRADITDDRRFVNLIFLVLRRVGVIKGPLPERYISADKRDQPAVLLIELIAQLNKILYNVHEQYNSFLGNVVLVDDIIPEKGGIALFMYKRAENPGKKRFHAAAAAKKLTLRF